MLVWFPNPTDAAKPGELSLMPGIPEKLFQGGKNIDSKLFFIVAKIEGSIVQWIRKNVVDKNLNSSFIWSVTN